MAWYRDNVVLLVRAGPSIVLLLSVQGPRDVLVGVWFTADINLCGKNRKNVHVHNDI